MSGITAIIIADSKVRDRGMYPGKRITTLQLCYQRFIHSEVLTHRVFSRNAMSSRAVPVAKLIDQVRNDPAMPIHWGLNQPGMQASQEHTNPEEMRKQWMEAAYSAASQATLLNAHGLHKQIVNRVLEPFQWMHTIVTATEWDNFFELRCHPDAQPEFQALANAIRKAMDESTPIERPMVGSKDVWHLPYVTDEDRSLIREDLLPKISAARCARVSYLKHDGTAPSVEDDLALFERLVGSSPIHASPIEHQAIPSIPGKWRSNNFIGWRQYRELYETRQMR